MLSDFFNICQQPVCGLQVDRQKGAGGQTAGCSEMCFVKESSDSRCVTAHTNDIK